MRSIDGFIPAVEQVFDLLGPEVSRITIEIERPASAFIRGDEKPSGFNIPTTNFDTCLIVKCLDDHFMTSAKIYHSAEFEMMVLNLAGSIHKAMTISRAKTKEAVAKMARNDA